MEQYALFNLFSLSFSLWLGVRIKSDVVWFLWAAVLNGQPRGGYQEMGLERCQGQTWILPPMSQAKGLNMVRAEVLPPTPHVPITQGQGASASENW